MMAIRAGASHVIGVEAFPGMASLAREVLLHNGMEEKVTVVGAHSSALVRGEEGKK